MRLKELLTRMMSSARPTLMRFWATVLLSIATTATLITATTPGYSVSGRTLMIRLALALGAGVLASLCAVVFWERRSWEKGQTGSRLTGNLAALLAAGVVSPATYLMLEEFRPVALSRHAAICVVLFLAFFVIPCARRANRLEMYVVRLFTQAVLSVLFTAVTFSGLSSITLTVSTLFSIQTRPEVYLHIWMVMAGVLAPFLFMSGIPEAGAPVEAADYPQTLRNLVLFVITPLISAYTAVLYVYFAKILITRQWPVGWVSHLVLWYSLVGIAALYFVWPLGGADRWADLFPKYFTRAVIPLLAMMLASIGIRIRHYGVTENRYYVVVVGLWALASALYLSLAAKRRSVLLPASLAAVVLLSVFGPWSSFAVSKWSQNRRLEGILAKYNMVVDGSIAPSSLEVSGEDRQEIAAILDYFRRYHDLADVKLLPKGFTMEQFRAVFGFEPAGAGLPKVIGRLSFEASNRSIDVSGYRYLFDYAKTQSGSEPISSVARDDVQVAYDRDSHRITVSLAGNVEWEKSLVDYIRSLEIAEVSEGLFRIRPEDAVFKADSPNLRVKVAITGLWGEVDLLTRKIIISRAEFFVLVGAR